MSEQAKRVSGSITITGFCYFKKTASATISILNSNKTAKIAFFNHAKRHHRSVRFQPKIICSTSGSESTSVESFRFLLYREVGFPEPLFLKPIPWDIRLYTYSILLRVRLQAYIQLIGRRISSQSIQDTDCPDHASERKKSKVSYKQGLKILKTDGDVLNDVTSDFFFAWFSRKWPNFEPILHPKASV